jgi:hypothetical protein
MQSCQKFRVSRTTRPSMPSGSYYKQTRGQLILAWEEELSDSLASFFLRQRTPLSHQQAKMAQSYGSTQQPQGEHRQFCIRTLWYNPAHPETLGKKLFSPSARSIRYNMRLRNRPSLFLSQCTFLNDNMVGFANITAREMIDHLFLTYGNITTVDLENNFEQMRKAWDPQKPVDTLFKLIQYCTDFSEA